MTEQGENKHWIGFDLGGTKMLAVVFDQRMRLIARKKRKTKAMEGREAGLRRIRKTIEEALLEAGITPADLGGIGIGAPGPLDLQEGILLDPPNLGWSSTPLKKELEKAFGCPAVLLNDVDAGVYGEYAFGAGKGARTVVGIFPGTGIGGGAVYDGKLVTGSRKSCMEIGHITVQPDGPLCGCGKQGCLEALGSRSAIAAAAAAAAMRGDAPYLLSQGGTDVTAIRSGVLAASIENGDATVEQLVASAGEWIGTGAAMMVNLMAPDRIILGGGLVEAMPELFLKTVKKGMKRHTMEALKGICQVRCAKLGDDAGVMGAAAWARKSLS